MPLFPGGKKIQNPAVKILCFLIGHMPQIRVNYQLALGDAGGDGRDGPGAYYPVVSPAYNKCGTGDLPQRIPRIMGKTGVRLYEETGKILWPADEAEERVKPPVFFQIFFRIRAFRRINKQMQSPSRAIVIQRLTTFWSVLFCPGEVTANTSFSTASG